MIKVTALACMVISMNIFAGECKKEDAKKAIEHACKVLQDKGIDAGKKELRKFRYCESNYVWLQDEQVNMLMHPIKRRLRGSLKANTDQNGKAIFVEFDKMAKANPDGGWVDYVWPKVGGETPEPKISFVKKCVDGAIAGSGIWK
ncbi:MAG: cache domain-containing protein [Bacteriovoracaceae bacterium]|nr:cache domain-containing protein [Bacteriovoracaceae bacterium]